MPRIVTSHPIAKVPILGFEGLYQKLLAWLDHGGEIVAIVNDLLALADRQGSRVTQDAFCATRRDGLST